MSFEAISSIPGLCLVAQFEEMFRAMEDVPLLAYPVLDVKEQSNTTDREYKETDGAAASR